MSQDNYQTQFAPPPRVSVVMSVYNGEQYLREAVNSIINQTFADFELILINDGSTDGTSAILQQLTDPRIVLFNHSQNAGLVARLREGVEQARGELIARMDADDISLPERFAKQVAFFDTHPEVGLLGTAMRQVDSTGRLLAIISPPTKHLLIKWNSLFEATVMHPTVMMRKTAVLQAGNYNLDYIHVEDTELWSRMIMITNFANLPDPLCIRRWRAGSISHQKSQLQRRRSAEIRIELIQKILGKRLPEDILTACLDAWANPIATLPANTIQQIIKLLIETNQKLIGGDQLPVDSGEAQSLQANLAIRILEVSQRDSRWITKLTYRWLKAYLPYSIKNWLNRMTANRRTGNQQKN
ncbi:glycosyltransferase [Patescibacteria group bacterium]|nr:glycosyltransferase [Patescibacteria group bacterium]